MPFIRYRTGDVGKLSHDIGRCKRGLEMLSAISGRTSDYLTLPDGTLMAGVNIAALFNSISNKIHIEQYQVVQEELKRIDLYIVKAKGYTDSDTELLKTSLAKHMGSDVNIEFKFVEEVPLTPQGKLISVISKLPVKSK